MVAKDKSDQKGIVVRVNGGELSLSVEKPTALDILKLAKKKGLIPGEPQDYFLLGDKGKYSGKDVVDVEEETVFLTIPNRPTPVA